MTTSVLLQSSSSGTAQTDKMATTMRCAIFKFQLVPLPSFVRAAVFGIVVELSETLVELSPDSTLLQVRHGQLVLLLDKGLKNKRRERRDDTRSVFGQEKVSDFYNCVHQAHSTVNIQGSPYIQVFLAGLPTISTFPATY